jgi:predicted AAA+ superfamily ATPase
MEIQRGSENLAGREIEILIPPLRFDEYLRLKGIKALNENQLWDKYKSYMNQQQCEQINN